MTRSSPFKIPRLRTLGVVVSVCLLPVAPGLQANTIYKCIDLDGFVSYSGMPCGDLSLQDKVIEDTSRGRRQNRPAVDQGTYTEPGMGEAVPEDNDVEEQAGDQFDRDAVESTPAVPLPGNGSPAPLTERPGADT